MTDTAPITQHGDSVVIRGAALPLLYRACFAMTLRLHRNGVASPPVLRETTQIGSVTTRQSG